MDFFFWVLSLKINLDVNSIDFANEGLIVYEILLDLNFPSCIESNMILNLGYSQCFVQVVPASTLEDILVDYTL